jgi:hypothetical protein
MNINWKLECLGKVMNDDGDKSGLEYEMKCLSCLTPVKSGCTELVRLVLIGGVLGSDGQQRCLGFEGF